MYQAVSLTILQVKKKKKKEQAYQDYKLYTNNTNVQKIKKKCSTNPHLFQGESLTSTQKNPFCRGIVWPCQDLDQGDFSGEP